jgi:hypothetical protein
MSLRLGIYSAIAIAKETTFGVSAAGSFANYHRALSIGMAGKPARNPRPHLFHGDAGFPLSFYDGQIEAGGGVKLEATYDGLGLILEAALGELAASTGPVGTQYTHAAVTSRTLPSYTVRAMKGTGTEETYLGCKVNRLTLSASAGEVATIEADWIAREIDGPTRAANGTTSPVFGAGQTPILGHQLNGATWNGGALTPRDLSFVLDNRLDRRNKLGSQKTAEPVITGPREVVVRVTLDWESDTLWTALQAGTTGALSVVFTGNGDDSLSIDLASAYVRSAEDPIEDAGIVSQTVEIVGQALSGSDTIAVTWTNAAALATSNG